MRKRFTDHPELLKTAVSVRREIPEDFVYDKKKLKHLKHILHNTNIALGTLTSILSEFSKIKGPEISPDGLLGGVGYIIPLKDIKQSVNGAVHNLSDVADCVADELTNPRWKTEDDKEIKKLIKEKEKVVEKVEEEISPDDVFNEEKNDALNEEKSAFSKQASDALSVAIKNVFIKFKGDNLC